MEKSQEQGNRLKVPCPSVIPLSYADTQVHVSMLESPLAPTYALREAYARFKARLRNDDGLCNVVSRSSPHQHWIKPVTAALR